jgi:CRP-like cAMP-binding protein
MSETLDTEKKQQIIAKHPLFLLLTEEDIAKLAALMTVINKEKNTIIVQENALIDNIYLIMEGEAEVTKKMVTVEKTFDMPLALLKAGDSIGLSDIGFYSKSGVRTATVKAATEVSLLMLPIAKFNEFIGHSTSLYHALQEYSKRFFYLNFIKKARPFANYSLDNLNALAEKIKVKILKNNDAIFQQDEIGSDCFYIESGEVTITQREANAEKTIVTLTQGACFGEAALLNKTKRHVTATATQPCTLLTLSNEDIFALDTELNLSKWKKVQRFCRGKGRLHPNKNSEIYQQLTQDQEVIHIVKNTANDHFSQLSLEGEYIWQRILKKNPIKEVIRQTIQEFNYLNEEDVVKILFEMVNSQIIYLGKPSGGLWGWIKHLFNKQ